MTDSTSPPAAAPRRRARRRQLSCDGIVAAAMALADREGIEHLTMRRVAADLGYEVMSLYNHVANKDELLAAMLDSVVAAIEMVPGRPWRPTIRATAISARDALVAHPWSGQLWANQSVGPARFALMESLLATLRTSGFGPELAYHGYHAVLLHIVGFTQQELAYRSGSLSERADEFIANFPSDAYPHLAEHIGQHIDRSTERSPTGDYEFVLDLILDGLERLKRQQRRR